MIEAVAPFLLAAGFRVRGWSGFERLTGRGAWLARIVAWALPCGLLAWALHGGWYAGAAVALGAWLGSLLGWWGSLDLGRREGTWLRDFGLHTARGLLWTAPIALAAWASSGSLWWLLGAGLLCGAAYEAGWRLSPTKATEIGEVAFGFIIGAALALTFP